MGGAGDGGTELGCCGDGGARMGGPRSAWIDRSRPRSATASACASASASPQPCCPAALAAVSTAAAVSAAGRRRCRRTAVITPYCIALLRDTLQRSQAGRPAGLARTAARRGGGATPHGDPWFARRRPRRWPPAPGAACEPPKPPKRPTDRTQRPTGAVGSVTGKIKVLVKRDGSCAFGKSGSGALPHARRPHRPMRPRRGGPCSTPSPRHPAAPPPATLPRVVRSYLAAASTAALASLKRRSKSCVCADQPNGGKLQIISSKFTSLSKSSYFNQI